MIRDAHSHVHDAVDSHIALLDEAGIDRAVLFSTLPHPERATDLATIRHEMSLLDQVVHGHANGPEMYRSALQEHDSAVAAHPDRVIGFGKVDPGRPAEQIAADVAQFVARGYRGVGELTPPADGAGRIEPVLQAAAGHSGLPVVVHGFAPTTAGDLATLAGLARRYPTVPLVISQLGGLNWLTAVELVRDTPSMYLELSTAPLVLAVRLALDEGPDRTLFGSGAPYGDPVLARAAVERVTRPGVLRDRVLGGGLAELLGL